MPGQAGTGGYVDVSAVACATSSPSLSFLAKLILVC